MIILSTLQKKYISLGGDVWGEFDGPKEQQHTVERIYRQ